MVDSDGSINTTKITTKHKDGTVAYVYQPTLEIPNTAKQLLEQIAQMVKPYKCTLYGPYDNHNGKPLYRLIFSKTRETLLPLLNELEPYMKLKSTQLKVLKEFMERDHTEEEKEFIHRMLQKLNKRGVDIQ